LAFRRFGSDGGEHSDNSGIGARRLTLQHLKQHRKTCQSRGWAASAGWYARTVQRILDRG
jgi:hypothetical protein